MTAGMVEPSPPLSTMAIPDVEYIVPTQAHGLQYALDSSPASPRIFKRHKTLPRPRNGSGSQSGTPDSRRSSSGSQSTHTLRHQRRSISGGELPPTPPAHSRTSSGSQSVNTSSLSPLHTPARSSEDVHSKASPSTPPNQRSPPTPEVTPPQTERPPRASPPRPNLSSRTASKSTTTDSRTESFRTALESPENSDEEDSNSTQRPGAPSARTSQTTVLHLNGGEKRLQPGVGLGLGAASGSLGQSHDRPPSPRGEFISFDGEWGSGNEVEQEWDYNLSRNVTVKKRRPRDQVDRRNPEAVDDEAVTPTNATGAARTLPLQGRILTYDSGEPTRRFTAPEPALAETSSHVDVRRMSGMSTKSAASTVVEAILVETSTPRQQKTLRHVKRFDALRDSVWQPSPANSIPSLRENASRRRPVNQARDTPRESFASSSTANSTSSRKARREVWKSGGVPVVVVPDRHSSNRPSNKSHLVQSAGSQGPRRNQSISSVPAPQGPSNDDTNPYFERPSRRVRRSIESDGSAPGDQRTIDYPPIVPRRTSSLSAPTSRPGSRQTSHSGSRAGSLTAESLKAHDSSMIANHATSSPSHTAMEPESSQTETSVPILATRSIGTDEQSAESYNRLKPDSSQGAGDGQHQRTADTLLGSPLLSTHSAHATPFSVVSVETAGTAAEISQATAVSIVPHKNRSVLMVDHRPSESSDGERESQGQRPIITTTEVDGTTDEQPATPPQEHPEISLHEVESPLRNPRAPPEPPVLQFIPATPSGLTPAEERPRMLGNFYEDEEAEGNASKGFQLVRRALNRRRNSAHGPSPSRGARPGFLTRTLSLNRNMRKDTAENPELDQNNNTTLDDPPRDESRLHPDWRPSYDPDSFEGDGDGVYDADNDLEDVTMRYPMIDNRPRSAKRSLSQRMKRTFAIMPVEGDYDAYDRDGAPERRTIRRSPSGNLRVVKHRGSMASLRRRKRQHEAATEKRRVPFFPRSYSLGRFQRRGSESDNESRRHGLKRTWSLTESVQGIPRRFSEKRREKRSNELRQKISGPRDVRDGVDDVIRRDGLRGAYQQPQRAEHAARSKL